MRLKLMNRTGLEDKLSRILQGPFAHHPASVPAEPILAIPDVLASVCARPGASLQTALGRCIHTFLRDLHPDPAAMGRIRAPASALSLALILYNQWVLSVPEASEVPETLGTVREFTQSLLEALIPATTRDTALCYHAVIQPWLVPTLMDIQAPLSGNILELSPLTPLAFPGLHLPAELHSLYSELIPGRPASPSLSPSSKRSWTAMTEALLADFRIARWVRHQWLAQPESRQSCRNIGLMLEALRRENRCRSFILEFYEAYDYFAARYQPDSWQGWRRGWPVLALVQELLTLPGDSESVIQMNRRGNEYFLKFRPLIELLITENKGLPVEFRYLTHEFVMKNLRPLLDVITESGGQGVGFGPVTFESGTGGSP